VNQDKDFVLI